MDSVGCVWACFIKKITIKEEFTNLRDSKGDMGRAGGEGGNNVHTVIIYKILKIKFKKLIMKTKYGIARLLFQCSAGWCRIVILRSSWADSEFQTSLWQRNLVSNKQTKSNTTKPALTTHLIPWAMSTQMPPLGDPQRLVLLLYFSDSFSWREKKVRPRKGFYLCVKGSRATFLFPIFTHGPQIPIERRELFPGKFAEVAGSRWDSSTVATVDTASALAVMSYAEL